MVAQMIDRPTLVKEVRACHAAPESGDESTRLGLTITLNPRKRRGNVEGSLRASPFFP